MFVLKIDSIICLKNGQHFLFNTIFTLMRMSGLVVLTSLIEKNTVLDTFKGAVWIL